MTATMDAETPHRSSMDRLVYMANQISNFFATQKHDEAVSGTAKHIGDFWDPRMRSMIFAHVKAGGDGLNPLALEALQLLGQQQA